MNTETTRLTPMAPGESRRERLRTDWQTALTGVAEAALFVGGAHLFRILTLMNPDFSPAYAACYYSAAAIAGACAGVFADLQVRHWHVSKIKRAAFAISWPLIPTVVLGSIMGGVTHIKPANSSIDPGTVSSVLYWGMLPMGALPAIHCWCNRLLSKP